jgi:Xaa-Pro aminopeptidase
MNVLRIGRRFYRLCSYMKAETRTKQPYLYPVRIASNLDNPGRTRRSSHYFATLAETGRDDYPADPSFDTRPWSHISQPGRACRERVLSHFSLKFLIQKTDVDPGMTNVERLQDALVERGIPAVVISNLPAIYWLTGFTGSFGLAVVTRDSGVFLTDSRYTIQAAEQCKDLPVDSFRSPQKVEEFLAGHVAQFGVTKLAFDRNHVTVGTLEKWTAALSGVELQPTDDPIDDLRMIKSAEEVAKVRHCCGISDKALEMLLAKARPGISELELLWAFEDFLRQHSATSAFDPIIVSGLKTARPHGNPGEKILEKGDLITFDLGARVDGYNSDITRTVVLGPASDRQRKIYEQLLKAQCACVAAMKPGVNGKDVDGLARTILDEQDLARHFGHGLGHGLGALVHDTGRLSSTVDQNIAVGQIWTIEPGVYIEGFGGMRIEDDIVITENGCDVLTAFPKHLIEIDC